MEASQSNKILLLKQQINKQYPNVKLSITIKEILESNHANQFSITNCGVNKQSMYHIVYDPRHLSSSLCHKDCYYCNSYKDLSDIVYFMCNNVDLYEFKTSDDVLDQEDTISLDYPKQQDKNMLKNIQLY